MGEGHMCTSILTVVVYHSEAGVVLLQRIKSRAFLIKITLLMWCSDKKIGCKKIKSTLLNKNGKFYYIKLSNREGGKAKNL